MSWLVQVTVVPFFTWSTAGWKAKLEMVAWTVWELCEDADKEDDLLLELIEELDDELPELTEDADEEDELAPDDADDMLLELLRDEEDMLLMEDIDDGQDHVEPFIPAADSMQLRSARWFTWVRMRVTVPVGRATVTGTLTTYVWRHARIFVPIVRAGLPAGAEKGFTIVAGRVPREGICGMFGIWGMFGIFGIWGMLGMVGMFICGMAGIFGILNCAAPGVQTFTL